MPNFNMVLTASGAELLAGAIVGTELTFTAIVLGDGVYDGAETDAAALASERLRLPITSIRRQGNAVSLRAAMRYEDAGEGFVWRELGVLARDPAGGADVLYSYANAGNQADTIPAAGAATVLEKIINVKALVASAASVTAVVDSSLVYLTQVDLDAHDADQNAHAELIAVHNSDGDAHSVIMRQKADLGANGKLVDWELGDIDCGYFDEAAADPVALHDQSPTVHMRMAVDGNTAAPADTSATLEEHVVNPLAHQNIDLDGNEN